MESKKWWLVIFSSLFRGVFSGSMFVLGGVRMAECPICSTPMGWVDRQEMERRQNEQGLAVAASDDGLKEELRKLQKQPRVGKMV